jgi:hypothetical protein
MISTGCAGGGGGTVRITTGGGGTDVSALGVCAAELTERLIIVTAQTILPEALIFIAIPLVRFARNHGRER